MSDSQEKSGAGAMSLAPVAVSVVVPVYNVEAYLPQCLDSLLAQTLRQEPGGMEILVVDDGSTDGSGDIADRYSRENPGALRVYHKENDGPGSARNMGLEEARGEYVGFVDGDDWVMPQMYASMLALGREKSADVVICDMTDHFPDRVVRHNCTVFSSPFKVTPSASNKIFRRAAVGEIRFPPSLWYEDFDFTHKVLLHTGAASVATISEDFYHCHCREISIMFNDNARKNLDIVTVLDDLRSFARAEGVYDEDLFAYLTFDHILITSINRVARQNSPDKREVIATLRAYCKENLAHYRRFPFYRDVPRNRRIVAALNYHGLQGVSARLIAQKERRSRRAPTE